MKIHSQVCVVAALCATLAACGGGGGDGGAAQAASGDSSPPRTASLEASAVYQAGPLTAPTGTPTYVKTVIGDLNSDGRNDVVTFTNETINGSDVVVLYQDQAGELSTFIAINSADLGLINVRDIAIADMNADGRADLVIYGIAGTAGPLVVVYQDGNGDLGSPVPYTVSVGGANLNIFTLGNSFAVGDFNSDGRNDVAINGSPMTVLLQGSDGSFGADGQSTFHVSAFTFFPSEVRIADMNSDGLSDIVYQSADKSIGVLRQVSPGVFSSSPETYPVTLTVANFFHTFAVGDLNGDGKNDVVVPDPSNSGFLNLFLQNSAGTLNAGPRIPIQSSPLFGIEIADIDQDGLNDIVGDVVDSGSPGGVGQVHVFYQNTDHTFQSSTVYTFRTSGGGGSQFHQALSIGDVSGDGRPDAVVSWLDEGVFVLLGTP